MNAHVVLAACRRSWPDIEHRMLGDMLIYDNVEHVVHEALPR
jgi:hypothetical protein